jgi:restriction system protein
VRNDYLGVTKVIRAMTRGELEWLAEAQLDKWAEQERRTRARRAKERERASARQEAETLKADAEADTEAAAARITEFRNVLADGLGKNLAPDWESMIDRAGFEPFHFDEPKPDIAAIRRRLLGPEPKEQTDPPPEPEEPGVFDFLPFVRNRRLDRAAAAEEEYERDRKTARAKYKRAMIAYRAGEPKVKAAYNVAAAEYNAKLSEAREAYETRRAPFLARQQANNEAVRAFRARYAEGSPEAIERYAQMVLEQSVYPDGIAGEPDVQFDPTTATLVINFWLPGPAELPSVVEHRYVASKREVKAVEMKKKEFDDFYDDVIHKVGLRTVHEVLAADAAARIEAVVFNGWVKGIDAKTGNEFTSCILTFQTPRQRFLDLDLRRVSPRECVRGFKGITAGPLINLAPVRPIMDIDRDDDRFVESKAVLDQLRPEDNLAAMEWEDFEHLVRELFEQEFGKTGGEVRVTQASRDRGVDAIAFDPDPIRGGKFVIQAKRYNMVVPVSAVRDLYGTMIAEGATKGILVTTSHFGRDSIEFAKDKPITLIDGQNLVYMFQTHGRHVHISILPKGDPRRGLQA